MNSILDRLPPVLRRCSWEITLACNLRCQHCGSAAGKAAVDEIGTGEALRVCRELADLGCREATLLGGEPFLRNDWDQIVSKLISLNIDVNIVSNGILVDTSMASRLADMGVSTIGLSIDGPEKIHNEIRIGHPDSYGMVLKAAENAGNAVGCISKRAPRTE